MCALFIFLGAWYIYRDVLGSAKYPIKATVCLAGVYDRPTNDISTHLRDEALGCPIRVFFPITVRTSIFDIYPHSVVSYGQSGWLRHFLNV